MARFSGLQYSLLKYYPYSTVQLALFEEMLVPKQYKKKELLLKPGQISNKLNFIETGSIRLYTQTDAQELTINFFTENEWVADIESFLKQRPSQNFLEAVENTNILSLTLKDLHALMEKDPCFRMLNGLISNLSIPTDHLAAISTKNPDMRYSELMLKHPDWINRFPQMQIASYLGMTPATLSRVRKRFA